MATKINLTDRTVQSAKPKLSRYELPDAGFRGLYLVVQPSGAKSWAYRYRSPADGKTKKFTIGSYPLIGLAGARELAGKAAMAAKEGRDPSAEKRMNRARISDTTNTVKTHGERFLKLHVRMKLRPTTIRDCERLFEREIYPAWGERKIDGVSKADIIALTDGISLRSGAVANRVLRLISKFFNWLVSRAVLTASPATGISLPAPELSRDRYLSDNELRWLWKATEGHSAGDVLRLLILTGQRRGEVAGMVWDELDPPNAKWVLPKERAKNGLMTVVPLSSLALEILAQVPCVSGQSLLFTTTGRTPVSGWSKFKRSLDARMATMAKAEMGQDYEIAPWRIHDIRRTMATNMAKLKVAVHVVEALLNHKSGTVSGVAAIYNKYDYEAEKAEAAQVWSNYVEELTTGRGDNVVDIRAPGLA